MTGSAVLHLQLACARIGAVHSVVFAGFSAESLAGRILDSKPNVVLTASAVRRGAKPIDLKVGCRQRNPVSMPRSTGPPSGISRTLLRDLLLVGLPAACSNGGQLYCLGH